LLSGLGFINVVIFLNLKFKVSTLMLDQLQSISVTMAPLEMPKNF
jgi:hypothetical protein